MVAAIMSACGRPLVNAVRVDQQCRACLATACHRDCVAMDSAILYEGEVTYMEVYTRLTQLPLRNASTLFLCDQCAALLRVAYDFVQVAVLANKQLCDYTDHLGHSDPNDGDSASGAQTKKTDHPCEGAGGKVIPTEEDDNGFCSLEELDIIDSAGIQIETVPPAEQLIVLNNVDIGLAVDVSPLHEPTTALNEEQLDDDSIYLREYDGADEVTCESTEWPFATVSNRWRCVECMRILHGDVSYEGHMNLHRNRRPYQCALCSLAFRCRLVLAKHMSHRHNETTASRSCSPELKEDPVTAAKQKRRRSPRQTPPQKTPDSVIVFDRGPKPLALNRCVECERNYATPKQLAMHRQRTHGERDHTCRVCGNAFKLKHQLSDHMRLHLDKNIACALCHKKYSRHHDLAVHMRTHTGELPFPCHLCPQRFAIKVRLTYHLQQHYGIKHKCGKCGAEFNSRQKLKAHSFKHTGMPYRCPEAECMDHGFAKRDTFKRHLQCVHNTDISDSALAEMFQRNTGRAVVIRRCRPVAASPSPTNP